MFVRHLTKELEEKARDELNEEPEKKTECLEEIIRWASEKYQLKFRKDDLWLLNFMRFCKFNPHIVKKKLETYLNLKATVPEMFANRDPLSPQIQEILKKRPIITFGTPDKDCVIVRWGVLQPQNVKISDVIKIGSMVLDSYLKESEACMVIGQYVIVDLDGFSFGFIKQVTPRLLKNIYYHFLHGYPCRIKGMYVINTPKFVEKVFKLSTYFMSDHLNSMTNVYGTNYSEIYSIIPKQYFPKEYGGNSESVIEATLKNKLENNREWFLENHLNRTQ